MLRPIIITCIVTVCVAFCGQFTLSCDVDEPGIITVSFLYKHDPSGNKRGAIKNIKLDTQSTSLTPGTGLKIFYQPLSDVHFYVYHVDALNNVGLLYKADSKYSIDAGSAYFIPPGAPDADANQWLGLDDNGPDAFYFIASTAPLKTLEELTAEHEREKSEQTRTQLLAQLENIYVIAKDIEQNNDMLQTPLKKYSIISGTVRSYKFKTEKVLVRNVYAKKITINH